MPNDVPLLHFRHYIFCSNVTHSPEEKGRLWNEYVWRLIVAAPNSLPNDLRIEQSDMRRDLGLSDGPELRLVQNHNYTALSDGQLAQELSRIAVGWLLGRGRKIDLPLPALHLAILLSVLDSDEPIWKRFAAVMAMASAGPEGIERLLKDLQHCGIKVE